MKQRELLLPVAEAIGEKAWPIRSGGHVYIFGRYMAARFPDDGGPAVTPEEVAGRFFTPPFGIFDLPWSTWRGRCVQPAIVDGRRPGCPDCDSRGHELGSDCDSCGGTGEAECDMGHFHDCRRCNSVGRVRTGNPCPSCGGSGNRRMRIVECPDAPRFLLDAELFSAVVALPGVRVAPDCVRQPDETGMFPFVCGEVEGILLGYRR